MQIENKYSANNHPSFGAIKSVECLGLYKKFPELGKELVDTFHKNPTAMDFCKKYDVKIIFHAAKDSINAVNSSIHIFYDNVAKSKFKKFINFLNSSEDKVSLSSYSNQYDIKESLMQSTKTLKEMIEPASITPKPNNGILDSHIEIADTAMQEALAKQTDKAARKQIKLHAKEANKNQLDENTGMLNDSIRDLIDSSK